MEKPIEPTFIRELKQNLADSPQFIQVVLGPRQVGKTTGVVNLLKEASLESLYFSADERLSPEEGWIEEKWQEAQLLGSKCVLVIDEIQKVDQWSTVIKRLWDRQSKDKSSKIQLVLLGSSSLQIQKGLTESLTGRFQLIRATHWGLGKSQELADLDVEQFVKSGGYPGSYALLSKPRSWEKYIQDSIVETVIGKDILHFARVHKPALFRQAFSIIMSYPAQEISYTKLLGQLQDSGNTDLVKSYIELYEGAYLIKSLRKYSGRAVVSKSSSPKLIPLCGALIDRNAIKNEEGYGRAFEAAVGACLINNEFEVSYWRDGNAEVDFVTEHEGDLFAIEVKSGRKKSSKGLNEFAKNFKKAKPVYVTPANIEKFLANPGKVLAALR
jgi:predicted AAA+ superfamily ATPase